MTAVIMVIALGFAVPPMFTVGRVALLLMVIGVVADIGLLYNWWPFRRSNVQSSMFNVQSSMFNEH
mgnify:CR=1 FL=1